jgi:hypothetical protein
VKVLVIGLGLFGCGTDMAVEDLPTTVDCSTARDALRAGMVKLGATGSIDVTLASLSPDPVARGDNRWHVTINSRSSGELIDDAMLTVTSELPDFGIVSPLTPLVQSTGTPGEYAIGPINLWMDGVWRVTITVQERSATDNVVYSFCVSPPL